MNNKRNGTRCRSLTTAGGPCGAAAMEGGLCFFHANPDKARELGRIGGRKNRRVSNMEATDVIPALDTAMAVQNKTAELIEGICSGRIHPRIGSGLAPLLSLQMRAIETTDLERRMQALEKRDAEAQPQTGDADGKDGSVTM